MFLEKPIFWSSERIQAEVIVISTLLHPKIEKIMTSLYPMMIKFYFLIF